MTLPDGCDSLEALPGHNVARLHLVMTGELPASDGDIGDLWGLHCTTHRWAHLAPRTAGMLQAWVGLHGGDERWVTYSRRPVDDDPDIDEEAMALMRPELWDDQVDFAVWEERYPGLGLSSLLSLSSQCQGDHPCLDELALHGPVGDVVRLLEPHSEAEPAAILATLLGYLGCMAGKGAHVVAGHVKHRPNLFPVVVGESAKARKGTSLGAAKLLLEKVDKSFLYGRERGGFGSGETLADQFKPDEDEDGNETPADVRLMVREEEFSRILNVCNRDGSTLSGVIRSAWDGSAIEARSRGMSSVVPSGAHVISMLGHITLEELRSLLTNVQVMNGFANRCLWVCARRSKRLPFDTVPNEAHLDLYAKRIVKALEKARKRGRVNYSPDAMELWTALYDVLGEDDPHGMLGSIVARGEPQVLRLALLYSVLDQSEQITADHLRAAWAFWSYCRASAEFIWGELTGDPVVDKLWRELERAGEKGLTATEQSKVFKGHVPGPELDRAREVLEARGWVVTERVSTGGRPSVVSRWVRRSASAKEEKEAKKGQAPAPRVTEPPAVDYAEGPLPPIEAYREEAGDMAEMLPAMEANRIVAVLPVPTEYLTDLGIERAAEHGRQANPGMGPAPDDF